MNQLLTKEDADLSRPYEKCLMFGAAALTDAELIAVVIRSGVKGKSATELAQKVLELPSSGSGLPGICHLSASDFMKIPGIGEVKAIQLMCVGELSKRIAQQRMRRRMQCTNPADVAEYYMEKLRHEEQECIICMMLDTRMRLIGEECITRGTVSQSLLSVRDVFLCAIRHRAVRVMLIHNHPSGDPTPSEEDIEVTRRIVTAGEILDIPLVDHLIIGDMRYVSFVESGLIQHGS